MAAIDEAKNVVERNRKKIEYFKKLRNNKRDAVFGLSCDYDEGVSSINDELNRAYELGLEFAKETISNFTTIEEVRDWLTWKI